MVATPTYKIVVNGIDKTTNLQHKVSTIEFIDKDGGESDEIRLTIAGIYQRPSYEDEIRLWIGYTGQPLFYCGLFLVQSTTKKNSQTIEISATGANFSRSLKVKRDASYESMTLGALTEMVARRHGLDHKSDMYDINIVHIAQTNESDLHLLKRLASDFDAIFSVKNGVLLFRRRESAGGEQPRYTLSATECSEISVKHTNKTIYQSCRASWHDTALNEVKSVMIGTGEPRLEIESQYKDAAEATAKAQAKLNKANRGKKSGSLTISGKAIRAGGIFILTGYGDDEGEYSIKSATHKIGKKWVTSLEFEN